MPRPTTSPTLIADAAVRQRERVVPVAADLEMLHRGAVGGRDLVARVGRQRPRQQARLQRAGDVALELVEPHALERERRLLGARVQERALVRRELARARERHREPPAPVRPQPRAGAAPAGLAGVEPGGTGERVRRQRPVDRQDLELTAALAPRDAGPARPEVLRQLARDRGRRRRGGRRRGEGGRDPLQPLDALARLALAVARGEQLLLVALAVGGVEHRRADDLPAHLGVDEHGQPAAVGADDVQRDLAHAPLHPQQRRVVRLVVDPPAAGQQLRRSACGRRARRAGSGSSAGTWR